MTRGRIAIVPMGFCFPGQDARGADLPPRKECAPAWRDRVFAALPNIRLVLAVGLYAQSYHLGPLVGRNLTETVADWREIMATTGEAGRAVMPLPHPSWRNNAWIQAQSVVHGGAAAGAEGRDRRASGERLTDRAKAGIPLI